MFNFIMFVSEGIIINCDDIFIWLFINTYECISGIQYKLKHTLVQNVEPIRNPKINMLKVNYEKKIRFFFIYFSWLVAHEENKRQLY